MLTPLMQDHARGGSLVRTDTDMAASDFEAPPPSMDEIATEVVSSCDDTAVVNSSDEGMAGASMEIHECQVTVGRVTDEARAVDTATGKNLQADPTKNLQARPVGQNTVSQVTDDAWST
jgi:hypothetical protein